MYLFVLIVHVVVCIFLILVILLQAGRGGGLSDMAGSGGMHEQNILGTQTNSFMTRTTTVSAILFIITSISLGIISTQKGKSLIEKRHFLQIPKSVTQPQPPKALESKPAVPAPSTAKDEKEPVS